jgi:hypothetical protein
MGERDEEGAAEDEAIVWFVATPDAGAIVLGDCLELDQSFSSIIVRLHTQ